MLLLTGAFEPVDEERARATGCDGILVKPFEPQQLIVRVRELLGGRRSPALWPDELPRVEAVPGIGELQAGESVVPQPLVLSPPPVSVPPPGAERPDTIVPPAAAAPPSDFGELDPAFAPLAAARAPALDAPVPSSYAQELAPAAVGTNAAAPDVSPRTFGDWDLPPVASDPAEGPREAVRIDLGRRTRAETPIAPFGPPTARATAANPPRPLPPVGKLSIANAFSALLAAEQTQPASFGAPVDSIPEAVIDEIVQRVVRRMADDAVRRTVLDVAERLIREEIEKIKAKPE